MAAAAAVATAPAATLVQHAAATADGLFSNIFRINLMTQQLNQQLWDEERLLTRSIQAKQRRQHWIWDYLPSLTTEDDERLRQLLSSQIQTNNLTIEWCQAKLQDHLTLTSSQRQALDQLRRTNRSWSSLVKSSLATVLRYGGLAALLYVADYYYNGSAGFNAVMSALGLHKYKLQQMLPQRALDWLKTKLRLHPASLVDKLWSSLLRVVRQKHPSLICRKLGICAGGTLRSAGAAEVRATAGPAAAAAEETTRTAAEGGVWLSAAHPGSGSGRTRRASLTRIHSTGGQH